jgi:hypothetical protein
MSYTIVFTHTTINPATAATITFVVDILPVLNCSKI